MDILDIILNSTDLYRDMEKISMFYNANKFFDTITKEDFEKIIYHHGRNYYKIFATYANINCNRLVDVLCANDYYLIKFNEIYDYMYSSFSSLNYEHAYKFLRKCEEIGSIPDGRIVFSTDVMNELLMSDFNSETLVLLLKECSNESFEFFVNNNEKINILFDRIPIRNIKYPDSILASPRFFEKLTRDDANEFRYNINNFMLTNPSTTIYLKSKEFDLKQIYSLKEQLIDEEYDIKDPYIKYLFNNLDSFIVDYLFEDYKENVIININEMMRYNKKNPILEDTSIYEQVLNMDLLSVQEKIDFFEKYKDQNLNYKFYSDIRMLKDTVYNHMNDIITTTNKMEKNIDEQLSSKHGVSVIDYRNKEFFMLVRRCHYFDNANVPRRCCYSLISDYNTSTYAGDYESGMCLYGFDNVKPDHILHTFEEDSYSADNKNDLSSSGSSYVNRIMEPKELVDESSMYSEIDIVNELGEDGKYIPKKPDYIVCIDNVSEHDINEASRFNIPLVLINERQPDYSTRSEMGVFGEENYNNKYR